MDRTTNKPLISTTTISTIPRCLQNLAQESESYILVWLCQTANVNLIEENTVTQRKLREVVSNFKLFDDCDQCVDYLTDIQDQKVVLIVSSSYGSQMVSVVHEFKQLTAIYIHCTEPEKSSNEKWSKDYEKTKGVFVDSKKLIQAFSKDQRNRQRINEKLVFNIYSRLTVPYNNSERQTRDSRNASFMYFYLLVKILLHLATNDVDSKSLKYLEDYSKKIYKSDDPEYTVLEEFLHDYSPNRVIWWYTRPTFLYETLNKALRNSDFDILFAFQLLIGDLYIQLTLIKNFGPRCRSPTNDPILRVFRGQAILVNDVQFMQHSVGDFVSMQSFLSTTTNREVAVGFAQATQDPTEDITRIVFQFNIDTRLTKTRPYANIKNFSYFHDEDEVLIMIGAIFRIEQLQFNEEEQMWNATLNLCNEDEYELKELLTKIETEVGNSIDSLGWFLYREGQYERAMQYFKQMLKDPSIGDLVKASCYYGMSGIALQLRDVDGALVYAKNVLDIVMKLNDLQRIATTHRTIGEIYYWRGEFDLAITYLQQALDVLPSNHPQLTEAYRMIANTYREKNDFNLALELYEKVLTMYEQQHLPLNHENYGIIYTNLAKLYEKKDDHEKELEFYIKAREVFLKSLPPTHPDHLTLETIITFVKKQLQKKYEQSMTNI